MKLLVCSINYAPELTGIGKYTGEMAAWLAAQGHDVRVVAAPPYYPHWRVGEGYPGRRYKHENLDGVDVWRCPIYVPGHPSGVKRILHLASFAMSSLPVMIRQAFWKPDVIVVIEPPLFCAPIAWLTARLSGAKCWLHVQDFEVDAAFDLGIMPFGWIKRMVSTIERWLTRRFDVVSTISNSMLKRLHEKGVGNPVLFPNWADLTRMQFDPEGREMFRGRWNVGDACVCLYSGNIAVKQGLEILLDVAARLPDCRFVICGEGANRKSLQDKAEALDLGNMMFLPLQPLERLPAMLSAADIHLVIQRRGAADLVLPSKLTNILAVGGRAVVTADPDTELGRLAHEHPGVIELCPPENAEALAAAVARAVQKSRSEGCCNEAARRFARRHLDRETILNAFERKLWEMT